MTPSSPGGATRPEPRPNPPGPGTAGSDGAATGSTSRPTPRRGVARLADWRLWGAAVGAAGLATLVGLAAIDVLVIGLAALAVGLVVPRLDVDTDPGWPRPRPHERHGARAEVAALTWSLAGRDGRVSEPAVRRLRTVAERRLARAGLPLSAGFVGPADARGAAERAAARAALGDRAWDALTMPGGRLPPAADVAACVRALEDVLPTREESR
ncbi:hypothetical protein OEB99_01205 [Actinotalea sp. M2MS4P-6]|uniref:hypothetical protein n=1 Tax=Actinotalea sp. M2MS4P-6 TaxID=2983762 RepID=UPI0021E3F967|nr:hypothetical protein [Actinotalea sp. M2MS4P-6]MCV2392913.1 hypothetical protein [Actinotalea sp. M2MS4P-6]